MKLPTIPELVMIFSHLLFFLLTYEVANHPCLSLKLNLSQLFAYFRLIGKERAIDLHRLFIFCFYFHIIVDSYVI